MIYIVDDAAAQVPLRGAPNHSLVNQLAGALWLFAARNSLSIWLERVSSPGIPAHPSRRGRQPPAKISSERTRPSFRGIGELLPLFITDHACGGKTLPK